MRRRDFIAGFAGSAATWPLAARAQQPAMPVVGFMAAGSAEALRQAVAAFPDGLKEMGFIEGQSVVVESRFAEGQMDRFPTLASDLVGRRVAVLVTSSPEGAFAAKRATTTTPIVFSVGRDPVQLGLVGNLNRPGGNMTGVYQFTAGLEGKRLALLHELVPRAAPIAALVDSHYSAMETQVRDVQEAAARLGVPIVVVRVSAEGDLNAAVSTIVEQKAAALLVCASPFFNSRRQQVVMLAARHGLPAIYEWRDFAAAGGLMSYGTNLAEAYRQAGRYAGRILKGEKPADLPVVQVTKFEFVINLRTAKALGIDVPGTISARADEIIE